MEKIILVGTSFGNLNIIKKLKNKKNLELTLITPLKYKVSGNLLPYYIKDEMEFSDVSVDIREFCRENKVRLVEDSIKIINFTDKWIKLDSSVINYDYLVFSLNGDRENVFNKSMPFIYDIKAIIDTKLNVVNDKQNEITFLGINSYNVERALAFRELSKKKGSALKITMIDENKDLSINLNEESRYKVVKELKRNGIRIFNGQLVSNVDDEKISLFDEDDILLSEVIHPDKKEIKTIEFEGVELIDGLFEVDQSLKIKGTNGAFALGELVVLDGQRVTKGKNHGRILAHIISKNILLSIKNKKLMEIRNRLTHPFILNLADNKALVEFKGHNYVGKLPKKIKYLSDVSFMDYIKEKEVKDIIN